MDVQIGEIRFIMNEQDEILQKVVLKEKDGFEFQTRCIKDIDLKVETIEKDVK